MNFAKNLLNKYGWKDGEGLGKTKQGIKRPIKANLKFDQAGLGADPSREFSNNWWERAFNDAAQNVKVEKQDNGDISIDLKDAQNSVEVTTKGYSIKKMKESGTKYGNNFLSEDVSFSSFAVPECKALTDEELFRACGGRTAHKGARHGLKLSGKLARLEQQEKELLTKMQTAAKTAETDTQAYKDIFKNSTESCDSLEKRSKRKLKEGKDANSEVPVKDTKSKKCKKEYQNDVEDCIASSKEQKSKRNKSKKKRKNDDQDTTNG